MGGQVAQAEPNPQSSSSSRMPGFKEKAVDWVIDVSRHGSKWWMPLLLILVSCVNSLTGGMLVWCIGFLQAAMFTVVGMSNGKVGVVLAPLCLTIGASIAAITYIQIMKGSGADALLEKTGAKDSKFLEKAQDFAQHYGALGLIFIQVNPLTPIPTAVLVVAGMIAKMDEVTVFSTLMIGKFLTLFLNSVVVNIASQGKSLEQVLREQLKGEQMETNEATNEAASEEKKDK